jgi:hypothetical protein
VCDIVYDLLDKNPDLRGEDIGVQRRTRADPHDYRVPPCRPEQTVRVPAGPWPERAAGVIDVEVKTVDGFEGARKQVIIFSTVQSNSAGYIGFLSDWRRLNVGLTRAKGWVQIVWLVASTLRA